MTRKFEIRDDRILFKPVPMSESVEVVNQARDFGQMVFFDEIRAGQELLFLQWSMRKGYIAFDVR